MEDNEKTSSMNGQPGSTSLEESSEALSTPSAQAISSVDEQLAALKLRIRRIQMDQEAHRQSVSQLDLHVTNSIEPLSGDEEQEGSDTTEDNETPPEMGHQGFTNHEERVAYLSTPQLDGKSLEEQKAFREAQKLLLAELRAGRRASAFAMSSGLGEKQLADISEERMPRLEGTREEQLAALEAKKQLLAELRAKRMADSFEMCTPLDDRPCLEVEVAALKEKIKSHQYIEKEQQQRIQDLEMTVTALQRYIESTDKERKFFTDAFKIIKEMDKEPSPGPPVPVSQVSTTVYRGGPAWLYEDLNLSTARSHGFEWNYANGTPTLTSRPSASAPVTQGTRVLANGAGLSHHATASFATSMNGAVPNLCNYQSRPVAEHGYAAPPPNLAPSIEEMQRCIQLPHTSLPCRACEQNKNELVIAHSRYFTVYDKFVAGYHAHFPRPANNSASAPAAHVPATRLNGTGVAPSTESRCAHASTFAGPVIDVALPAKAVARSTGSRSMHSSTPTATDQAVTVPAHAVAPSTGETRRAELMALVLSQCNPQSASCEQLSPSSRKARRRKNKARVVKEVDPKEKIAREKEVEDVKSKAIGNDDSMITFLAIPNEEPRLLQSTAVRNEIVACKKQGAHKKTGSRPSPPASTGTATRTTPSTAPANSATAAEKAISAAYFADALRDMSEEERNATFTSFIASLQLGTEEANIVRQQLESLRDAPTNFVSFADDADESGPAHPPAFCTFCHERQTDTFVECPTQTAHNFCFPCTREHIKEHATDQVIYCPSGEKCLLQRGGVKSWALSDEDVKQIMGDEFADYKKANDAATTAERSEAAPEHDHSDHEAPMLEFDPEDEDDEYTMFANMEPEEIDALVASTIANMADTPEGQGYIRHLLDLQEELRKEEQQQPEDQTDQE